MARFGRFAFRSPLADRAGAEERAFVQVRGDRALSRDSDGERTQWCLQPAVPCGGGMALFARSLKTGRSLARFKRLPA
jgi:hypothetical protein